MKREDSAAQIEELDLFRGDRAPEKAHTDSGEARGAVSGE